MNFSGRYEESRVRKSQRSAILVLYPHLSLYTSIINPYQYIAYHYPSSPPDAVAHLFTHHNNLKNKKRTNRFFPPLASITARHPTRSDISHVPCPSPSYHILFQHIHCCILPYSVRSIPSQRAQSLINKNIIAGQYQNLFHQIYTILGAS